MNFAQRYLGLFLVVLGVLLASGASSAHATVVGGKVPLTPTPGTTSFYIGVTYQGLTRNVLVIQPNPLPAGKSPAIVMLHYDTGTPELQANGTRAANLAAKMGFWVILPPAVNGHWNDDPSQKSPTADDVGFLQSLINTMTTQYPIDSHRISMNGLSNGGFMTQRFVCAHPEMIASAVAVAAEMRNSQVAICTPSRPVPMIYVNGTADPLVPYNGMTGLIGAMNSFAYWGGLSACNMAQSSTQNLPILVNDGTSVTLEHNASCTSRGEVDIYTVINGGHAWPGGQPNFQPFGVASQNLDTTTMIGTFAQEWTNESTI